MQALELDPTSKLTRENYDELVKFMDGSNEGNSGSSTESEAEEIVPPTVSCLPTPFPSPPLDTVGLLRLLSLMTMMATLTMRTTSSATSKMGIALQQSLQPLSQLAPPSRPPSLPNPSQGAQRSPRCQTRQKLPFTPSRWQKYVLSNPCFDTHSTSDTLLERLGLVLTTILPIGL